MGLKDKLKNFVMPEENDEYVEYEEEEETSRPINGYEKAKGDNPIRDVNKNTNIVLFEPRSFE
ncbi:MAG: hypothetical protein WBO70_08010, partial [Erysipelotrichaceae bacterium]